MLDIECILSYQPVVPITMFFLHRIACFICDSTSVGNEKSINTSQFGDISARNSLSEVYIAVISWEVSRINFSISLPIFP